MEPRAVRHRGPGDRRRLSVGRLNFDGPVTCRGAAPGGNDGTQCEYGALTPGSAFTVTETIVAQVQATSTGYATDVACAHALDQTNYDPQPGNDCEIATVAIDPSKTPSPAPSGVTHGGAAETLPPASTVAAPQTNTGGSKPAVGSCPAYTAGRSVVWTEQRRRLDRG